MPTARRRPAALVASALTVLVAVGLLGAVPGLGAGHALAEPTPTDSPTAAPSASPTCLPATCGIGRPTPSPTVAATSTPTATPTATATAAATPSPTASPTPRHRTRTSSPRPASAWSEAPGSTADPVSEVVPVGPATGSLAATSSPSPTAAAARPDARASLLGEDLGRLLALVVGAAVLLGLGGATGLYLTRRPHGH